MTTRSFSCALAAILLAALAVRALHLGADAPTDVSRDLSLSTDASWYSARAVDDTIGRDSDVTGSYDKPLYTAYLRALYAIFGPSLATTNGASIPFALVAIAFTALLARRLGGDVAGLLAAAFLALNYPYWVFNRSAVPYTMLSAVAAITLWASVRGTQERSPWFAALAWMLFLAGTLLLKEILVLLAPALLVGWPLVDAVRRRPLVAAGVLLVAGAVGALGAVAVDLPARFAQKMGDYLAHGGDDGVLARALGFEDRSHAFALLPILLPLALTSGLGRRPDRAELQILWHLLGGLLVFVPFGYSPIRYLVPLFPAIAALGACAASRWLAGDPAASTARAAASSTQPRRWDLAWQAPALGLFAYASLRSLGLVGGAAAIIPWSLALAAVLWLGWRGFPVALRERRALTAAVAVVLLVPLFAVQATRTSVASAKARYSTRGALADVESVVSPRAVLSGPFAHLLTSESSLERRLVSAARFGKGELRRLFESRGVTHLAVNEDENTPEVLARFAFDDAPLEHVHTFWVREMRILLLRFRYADRVYERSEYELAIDLARDGETEAAIAHLRAALTEHPRSAAVRSALADLLAARGETTEAFELAGEALARNPCDARALGVRARLLLGSGQLGEAVPVLRALSVVDPASAEVRDMLRRVEAALAARGASTSP